MIRKERLPLLLFAMLCLLAGLWSGLTRIGWDIYILPVAAHHGAVMVGGFLGTLIFLEKVIPLKKRALLSIPLINASGIVFFFFGLPSVAISLLIAASLTMLFVFLHYYRLQRNVIYALMLAGTVCLLTGNVLLLSKSFYPLAFPWWTAFALFIIAAERLELTAFLPVKKSTKNIFIILLVCFVTGVAISFHGTGNLICGVALIGIGLWLMRFDLVGLNLKKSGLPRYVAIALLCGYFALLLTGIFFFTLSDQWLNYDALVHSFFIGFVFSMIFAHGPMILPGVLGISASPFSKLLYWWLGLLQASWLIRVFADVAIHLDVRKFSGLLSAVAIVGYFATMVILISRSHRHA